MSVHPAWRVARIRAWDATPGASSAIAWSETGPAVRPRQVLVAVDVEEGRSSALGIAAVTRYPAASDPPPSAVAVTAELEPYVGLGVTELASAIRSRRSLYEPALPGLGVVTELAVLDALGTALGLPAAVFLGGVQRTEIPAYASLPSFPEPQGAIDCAQTSLDEGYRAIKFHATGDPATDIDTIRLARAGLPRGTDLLWDATCAYDLYGALLVGRALVEAEFLWFEAPMRDDAGPVIGELARRIPIPLIPDATAAHRSVGDLTRDVAAGVWGGLRFDVTRVAGVGDALRLLRVAEAFGLPCEVQSFGYPLAQYANLAVMAATSACRYFEAPYPADDMADDLLEDPPLIDGLAQTGVADGLGHGLDANSLETLGTPVVDLGEVHRS